jgi:hypothetical protein
MSDTLLWSLAIGVGALGLLLLAVAGLVAMLLSGRLGSDPPGIRQRTGAEERVGPTELRTPPSGVRAASRIGESESADGNARAPGGLLLAWLKAWVFAFIHAGAVSFVLGGMTFFEDLVKANEEIRRTGSVSFPRRLLPGAFSGPDPAEALAHRSGEDASEGGRYGRFYGQAFMGRDQPSISTTETVEWKVVDILDEAGPDGQALAGGYRPDE